MANFCLSCGTFDNLGVSFALFLFFRLDFFVAAVYYLYGTWDEFVQTFALKGCAMIERSFYLQQLKNKMWNGNIKVITGIRRCGKSTLLFDLFKDYLLSDGVAEQNIVEIQLDKRKFLKYRNPIVLCDYVESIVAANPSGKYYLFVDEVQLSQSVVDPESGMDVTVYDMLNELKDYNNLDCYVTGSNSKMLSSDIATEFRGRSSQIRVHSLSFAEYYLYRGGAVSEAIDEYMVFGGMPGLLAEQGDNEKKDYLKKLYDEIYIKDLVEHGNIKREDVLKSILDYVASQVGSLTNASKITAAINASLSVKIDDGLVTRYLYQLSDAFIVEEAKRFDIKGKKYFSYPNKYYYTDIGLRNARLNFRQIDPGHIMENIIYNELVRRGYSVDVGVVEDRRNSAKKSKEIDFVVNSFDKKIYIQSALRMDDNYKQNAELDSLRLTEDFFKKIVIRNDIPTSFFDEEGIYHVSFADFLLDKVQLF